MLLSFIYRFQILVLLVTWTLLFYPSLSWLFQTLITQYQFLNLTLLILIVSISAFKITKNRFSLINIFSFQIRLIPLILIISSSLAYVVAAHFVSMNILNCMICLFSGYGLIGFFIPESIWKKGLIPVILLIQTLPFGHQLDIYFGFPLRLHAAEQIGSFLSLFHFNGINREAIITIENRSAEISAACSGLNGIWTAWLFYFFLTWIEKRSINWLWLLFFAFINLLVYSFNILRITILVILESILNYSDVAKIIHVPLGIAGFIFSCFLTWQLMNLPIFKQKINLKNPNSNNLSQWNPSITSPLLPVVLAALFIVLLFFNVNREVTPVTLKPLNIQWPSKAIVHQINLQKREKIAFKKEGGVAQKFRFDYLGISGSCLISYTSNWRAHHPPDLCTQGNGYAIENSKTVLIDKEFPVNILELKDTNKCAVYWFQSGKYITQDHAARVWEGISSEKKKWVMISILFEQNEGQKRELTEKLLKHLKQEVIKNFE